MIVAGIFVRTPLCILTFRLIIYCLIILILDMLSTAVVVGILVKYSNEPVIWLIQAVENIFLAVLLSCLHFTNCNFQADKVDMFWNKRGTGVLLMTSTEVDKSGSSYYGKQALHFISTKGETAMVLLSK